VRETQTVNGGAPPCLPSRLPPERDLLTCVVETARLFGWLAYHPWRSDNSERGWPDLVLVKPGTTGAYGRALFVELKRSDRQRLTADQAAWGQALLSAGLDWRRWTWQDWHSGEVERVLRERA